MKVVITLVALLCLQLNLNAGEEWDYCYYFNDPHLIPFDTPANPNPGVYFCRSNCTEILLKNKYVEIIVTADPQGAYPIVQYTIIFLDPSGILSPCVVTNSIANPGSASVLCQSGSAATSSSSGGLYAHSHSNGQLEVEIRNMSTWFNIYIEQTSTLIADSTGVCVNWTCSSEKDGGRGRKKRNQDLATFNKIIDTFIKAASSEASNFAEVDTELENFLRIAVLNDLRNTLNAEFAKTIVFRILESSVGRKYGGENNEEYVRTVDEIANKVIGNVVGAVNEIIRGAKICREIQGARKCLEPIGA